MKRGEIWWASLTAPEGSGPGYRRPVLVVQANSFNESRISTVLVAVITSNLALAQAPGNVRMSKSDSGLSKTSVVNISQILTIDRRFLTERVSYLPGRAMERVNEGLKLVLSV
jgi:mRNA interferase MazF